MTDQRLHDARSAPVTLSIAKLDRDPHDIFRRYRSETPLITRPDGTYIVIRADDVERLDHHTRQLETELLEAILQSQRLGSGQRGRARRRCAN